MGKVRGIEVAASSTNASNEWLMVEVSVGFVRGRGVHCDWYASKMHKDTAVHLAAASHAPCPAPQKGLVGGLCWQYCWTIPLAVLM